MIGYLVLYGFLIGIAKAQTCGEPTRVTGAFVSGALNSYPVGAIVNYTCNGGFSSNTPVQSTCLANFTWSEVSSTCELQDCGSPPTPSNGDVVEPFTTTFGSSITFFCIEGYNIVLPSNQANRRSCAISGNSVAWSGQTPTCEVVQCPDLPDLPNGTVINLINQPQFGNTIRYECNPGFRLSNASLTTGTCQADGGWGEVPTCIVNYDCSFSSFTNQFCGYTSQNLSRRIQSEGFNGFANPAAESIAGSSFSLTSSIFDTNAGEACLSFYYRFTSSNLHPLIVSLLKIGTNPESLFESGTEEIGWTKVSISLEAGQGDVQWSFQAQNASTNNIQLDEIILERSACPGDPTTTIPTTVSTTTDNGGSSRTLSTIGAGIEDTTTTRSTPDSGSKGSEAIASVTLTPRKYVEVNSKATTDGSAGTVTSNFVLMLFSIVLSELWLNKV